MNIGIKMSGEQKKFYKALFALVIPIAIQNFISNAVNSADVIMLGYVGQTFLRCLLPISSSSCCGASFMEFLPE